MHESPVLTIQKVSEAHYPQKSQRPLLEADGILGDSSAGLGIRLPKAETLTHGPGWTSLDTTGSTGGRTS